MYSGLFVAPKCSLTKIQSVSVYKWRFAKPSLATIVLRPIDRYLPYSTRHPQCHQTETGNDRYRYLAIHDTGRLMSMNNLNPFSNHNVTPQWKGRRQGRKYILISHGDKRLKGRKINNHVNRGCRVVKSARKSSEWIWGMHGLCGLFLHAVIDQPYKYNMKHTTYTIIDL